MHNTLIALQLFQVAFLAGHDWIPLPPLNDVRAVQAADPFARLLAVTLISTLPYAFGLMVCLAHASGVWPIWLLHYLWITYGLLLLGQLRAWWMPYLLRAEPERAMRYAAMFGRTHAFLPVRRGIQPNTLHIVLHASTLATLLTLFAAPHHGW